MKSHPEIIAAECLALRIRKLNRIITDIYNRHLHPHGLKVSQLNILIPVQRLKKVTLLDLSDILGMDNSSLSRTLNLMIGRGWIAAETTKKGRIRTVRLTHTGQELLENTYDSWQAAQQDAQNILDSSLLKSLKSFS